ncbi:flagellar basal body protein FliL [Paracoccus sp. Z330]|uniref:Flagellar protein FliL n=1 Tax=Paracoccus onchidii TaxID=3017813 RepID=A0ABT4ZHD9_9RHOB|nr:flagellar basal body-associated FliL family protein [Paracoccus onchidii]MDB6178745.1 flagellar basal body protein FliL [Paracoccus onchidii]
MTQATEAQPGESPGKKRPLVMIGAVVLLAGCGFASTYLGLWSPTAMLGAKGHDPAPEAVVDVIFVNVPRIEQSLPGGRGRNLLLAASIETDAGHAPTIEQLMPRVTDSFNGFIAGVDPAAYDKRGVLEIVRAELTTRARQILGEEAVKGLLITEFLIR